MKSRCKVEQGSTSLFANLLADNQQKVVVVRTYVNASFVSLTIEKKFYENFEKVAEQLGVRTQTLINNALITALKAIKNLTGSKIDT